MVSFDTLSKYFYWTIPFIIHTYAFDKQTGAVIGQETKPLPFFSRKLSKPQRNCTTTEKELLAIAECLKQFRWIIFCYGINVFSYHKNIVYAATWTKYQRVICWKLILKEFEPNIQHISEFDNIVSDMLSIFIYAPIDKYNPITIKAHCRANELSVISRAENNKYCFPLDILNVQI